MDGRGRASSLEAPWLFQREGQVFGPVPAKELLRMLYAGELSFDSLVAPDGKEFRPVERFEMFKVHRPKVELTLREAAERARRQKAEASLRLRRRASWAAVAVTIAVLGGWGLQKGRELWTRHQAAQLRADAETKLARELEALMASVTIQPPLQAIEPPKPKKPTRRVRRRRARTAPSHSAGTAPSEAAIQARMASLFPRFKRCIVEQLQRAPDSVRDELRLRFGINNEGRVADFSLSDRFLRRSPLQGCIGSVLSAVRWPPFRGEVRNVEYPIRIGRS